MKKDYNAQVQELAKVTEKFVDLKAKSIEDKVNIIEHLMQEAESHGERMVIDACLIILNKMLKGGQ